MLRSDKTQTILSSLAASRNIHVIASIDHINAPLREPRITSSHHVYIMFLFLSRDCLFTVWDAAKSARFSWLWFDVTTFDFYARETSYENSLLVSQSGSLALSSLVHVMRSLTPNARRIFLLLAQHQLEQKQTNYAGMAFADLYQRCREAFLVNSDLTLRAQLTEFNDHKLLRSKRVSSQHSLL